MNLLENDVKTEFVDKLLSLKVNVQPILKESGDIYHAEYMNGAYRFFIPDYKDLTSNGVEVSNEKLNEIFENISFDRDILLTFQTKDFKNIKILECVENGNMLSVPELNKIADQMGSDVAVAPVGFQTCLTDIQKESIKKWCAMSGEEKDRELGDRSFSRYIVTVLTGTDPETVQDSIGFVFTFTNDADTKVYKSYLIDPEFEKNSSVQEMPDSSINDIMGQFIKYYDKHGFITSGTSIDDIIVKNFQNVVDSDSKLYNKLLNMQAGTCSRKTVTDFTGIPEDFARRLNQNELLSRLFNMYRNSFDKLSGLSDSNAAKIRQYVSKIRI